MLNHEAAKINLQRKSNEELLDILSNSQEDYEVSAISILKEILSDRGVAPNIIEEADSHYKKLSKKIKELPHPTLWDKATKILITGIVFYALGYCVVKYTHRSNPSSEDKPWSPNYENAIYNSIYKTADTIFQDDESKKEFTSCAIKKLKSKYPSGLETIPNDSLNTVYYKTGEDCAISVSGSKFKKWTPEYETFVKRSLMLNEKLKNVKEKVKALFCDCYVEKLKEIYPNGIVGVIPADVQNKLAASCVNKILSKKHP